MFESSEKGIRTEKAIEGSMALMVPPLLVHHFSLLAMSFDDDVT